MYVYSHAQFTEKICQMKRFLFIITLTLALVCSLTCHADNMSTEDKVKAAYLYNFAKFIKWPGPAFIHEKSPLLIGVMGDDSFADKLGPLTSRTVRNRPFEIKKLKTSKQAQACHMVYINTSSSAELSNILEQLKARPIITIGDNNKFAAQGGIIQFIKIRDRLRFIINLDAAKINQVQINAQLLSLATELLETKE